MCTCEIGFLFYQLDTFDHQQVSFKNAFEACGTGECFLVIARDTLSC